MKAKELKEKDISDLEKLLKDKRKELAEFYSNISGSKTRNVKEARDLKKNVARILTEISAKKRA